ncbi:uncharacterized protein M6B38_271755 [Iris pallida]|uniref:Transposase MuDR plant domain-containing protein n=2 Tax=Iris pallida TaxID=29817 RepID=A0AAX6I7M6_IRIPA|nr:uncharacterized protein M6B38_271755 [Iris pallida]
MNNAKGIIYTCNQPTCRWRVYARPIRRGNIFQIATLENRHSCLSGLTTGSHPLATSSWVKNKIINIIRDNQSYSPSQVVMDIHREHRINISYSKAWRAREMAFAEINGSYFDAYASLEEYSFRIIESNPGSSCFLKTTENNSFQRIFICFKACIDGFWVVVYQLSVLMLLSCPPNTKVYYLLLVLMIRTINFIQLLMLLQKVRTQNRGLGS